MFLRKDGPPLISSVSHDGLPGCCWFIAITTVMQWITLAQVSDYSSLFPLKLCPPLISMTLCFPVRPRLLWLDLLRLLCQQRLFFLLVLWFSVTWGLLLCSVFSLCTSSLGIPIVLGLHNYLSASDYPHFIVNQTSLLNSRAFVMFSLTSPIDTAVLTHLKQDSWDFPLTCFISQSSSN